MLCSALALSVGTAMATDVGISQVEYSFSIAGGSVESVLLEIARQSHQPISFNPSLVAGRVAAPIQGTMPLCNAFDRALKGLGLELLATTEGIWTLRVRSPKQAQPLPIYALPDVLVVGERKTAADEGEILLNSSATATPHATPLSQIPYSVSTINNATIERQQSSDIGEALQNASGVSVVVDTTHAYTTGIRLRGLDVHAQTLDGMLDSTGYPAPLEGIQRIDIVKGPADSSMGNLSGGGLINIVTKRPEMNETSTLSLHQMENGRSKIALDHSGVLGNESRWSYRLDAMTQHNFRNGEFKTPPSEDYFAASLRYRNAKTDWTIGLQRYRQRPEIQPFTTGAAGGPDRDSTLISPQLLGEERANESTRAYYLLEQQISPAWVWRSRANWSNYQARYRYFVPDFLAGESLLYGWTQETLSRRQSTTIANELVWSLNTNSIRQEILIGFGNVSARTKSYVGENVVLGTLDLASQRFAADPFETSADISVHRLDASSLYLQDQISIGDRLKLLASVRRTRSKFESNVPWTVYWDEHESVTATRKTSTSLGASYQLTPEIAVYASTMKGTNSIPEKISAGGQGLVPEQIRQNELGLKFDLLDDKLQARVSTFRLNSDYTNLPQPWMSTYYVTFPGQRQRGVEAEVSGQLRPGWDVIANFTQIDSKLNDTTYPVYWIGTDDISVIPGQPRRFWRLWTSYAFQDEPLKNWGGTFGVTSVSSSYGDVHGEVVVPGYSRLDASVFFRRTDFSIELGIKNLMNTRIYTPTVSPLRISTQPSRQIMLTMKFMLK